MTVYVLFLAVSMGAGGMMPWILQHALGYLPLHAAAGSSSGSSWASSSSGGNVGLQRTYREEPGYTYVNNNRYTYCKKTANAGGEYSPHIWYA